MKLELRRIEKFGGIEARIDGKLFDNAIEARFEGDTVRLELRFDMADVTYENVAALRETAPAK